MAILQLSSKQRRHLKGLAHSLKPIVRVGKGGVDEMLVASTDEALEAQELIKVKVLENAPEDRDEVATTLADATNACLVSKIGRTFVLYRPRKEGKKGIEFPPCSCQ